MELVWSMYGAYIGGILGGADGGEKEHTVRSSIWSLDGVAERT